VLAESTPEETERIARYGFVKSKVLENKG